MNGRNGRTGSIPTIRDVASHAGVSVATVSAAQIFGAQGHSGYGNFPNVVRLMAARRIDLTPIITSRFSLARRVEALQKAMRREDGKIMIRS